VTAAAPDDPDPAVEIRPIKPGSARLRARYAEVHALRAAGHSLKAIRRQAGLARPTIRTYLRATSCPERAPRPGFFAPGAPWERRLRERWNAGEHNAAALWRALRAEGAEVRVFDCSSLIRAGIDWLIAWHR
jgi:hypothetical protein